MKPLGITCVALLLFSCASPRTKWVVEAEDISLQEEMLDTLVITDDSDDLEATPRTFRPSARQTYDILHTKLSLSFDWKKQHVYGVAEIQWKPYFFPVRTLVFDAVGFEIHKITTKDSRDTLPYNYDGKKLTITLDREYNRQDTSIIQIRYTAKPEEVPAGGSEAITSEKGLFFIDPLDEDPDLPSQIWTQGETENNSRWFPTFDKPNERFSQEILLTVDTMYETLSNGKLVSSILHGNGTRTDTWRQDKAHAPYLTMIAVGDYFVKNGEWNRIPLQYFVEKKYSRHAERIFDHTPEMLSFFSDKLGIPYPWDKYSQIVVRNFVSGAMENTGAVVFGDFVQKTDKELIDNGNDEIVAHEMMHHWFGNLVTCEDWSNLTLNEGFANYAEYLWLEYKYGRDRAEEHRMNEMGGYFNQTFMEKPHALVDYYYADKEKMFDAHSYNKGGLVMHMLRKYTGDEAFFAALQRYLSQNQFSAVELDELRLAFEDVTGEDLNWFFEQWFLSPGHPSLVVSYSYDSLQARMVVDVEQTQEENEHAAVFRLPVRIAVYAENGEVRYFPVVIDQRKQQFQIEDLQTRPAVAVLDGDAVLLASVTEQKTKAEYIAQFRHSTHFFDKYEALYNLQPLDETFIKEVLEESYPYFRAEAIRNIPDSIADSFADRLQALALSDAHSEVRREALIKLSMAEEIDLLPICHAVMLTESAYSVLDVALQVISMGEPEKVGKYTSRLREEDSDYLSATLVGIMGPEPSEEEWYFMERKARSVGMNHLIDYYGACQSYLTGKSVEILSRAKDFLTDIASDPKGNTYRKYMAFVTLLQMGEDVSARSVNGADIKTEFLLEALAESIRFVLENEQNPVLKEKYSEMR